MWLTGQTTYAAARMPFILIAACIPPLTAALAYKFSGRRDLAITSGLLAIFSVFHAPFVGVTDNFGLFMLFGGFYFLVTARLMENPSHLLSWFCLGLLAGLMTLSRTDGLLWLGLAGLFALWKSKESSISFTRFANSCLRNTFFVIFGFLLIMFPWYARNLSLYGSVLAPGGSRALWLDNYDQTFTFPASQLTMRSFLALGWQEIFSDRWWALGNNLQSAFAAHGGIILFPFIIIGIIRYRKDDRVRIGLTGWLILFTVMTVIFPFAGARGGFFHAGAAFQPLWWTLAPLGLEAAVVWARKRGLFTGQAQVIFRSAMVLVVIILTGYVTWLRMFSLGWGEGEEYYQTVEKLIVAEGAVSEDVVIVRNPVGYNIMTGRSAIVIPYGDDQTIRMLARQFEARYLILEQKGVLPQIKDLYEQPRGHEQFSYLGEIDGTRIFEIIE
jgi:hypothetical protein